MNSYSASLSPPLLVSSRIFVQHGEHFFFPTLIFFFYLRFSYSLPELPHKGRPEALAQVNILFPDYGLSVERFSELLRK